MSSALLPGNSRLESDRDPHATGEVGGCVWLATWLAAIVFALGAVPLGLVIVTRNAGAFGLAALLPLVIMMCAVVALAFAAGLSVVDRLWHRRRPFARTIVAVAAFTAGTVSLAPVVAELLGVASTSGEGDLPMVAGVSLIALAAVLAAHRGERRPALAFATAWVLLVAVAGYSFWTEMEVEVAWLGPGTIEDGPAQFAFKATRPGDFEIRFGARSCSEGRIIATGRYEHEPDQPGSTFGKLRWVELPADVLPLERGDLVRACVRDGLATATRAAEAVDPPSHWQRD